MLSGGRIGRLRSCWLSFLVTLPPRGFSFAMVRRIAPSGLHQHRLVGITQGFATLFPQVFLQQHCIPGIGFIQGVRKVANKGNQPDSKIKNYIEKHLNFDVARKPAFDFGTGCDDHQSEERIDEITGPLKIYQVRI